MALSTAHPLRAPMRRHAHRLRAVQTHLDSAPMKDRESPPVSAEPTAAWAHGLGVAAALAAAAKMIPRAITKANAGPADLEELIAQTPKNGKRCAVIGIAISGTQAMKNCLAEGFEPVGFESDSDIGGLWRYKSDPKFPSVYRSTHIDSDRDVNSFGDYPWDPEKSLLIHNTELVRYLRENLTKFGLMDRIRLNSRVSLVTPVGDHLGEDQLPGWEVHYTRTDPETGATEEMMEVFDCVLVCSGRHGGGGFIPQYRNQELFKGPIMHSSQCTPT